MSIEFGPFRLDGERRRLSRGDALLPLGDRAFDILAVLAAAEGRIVSKRELMAQVWPEISVEENNLHVHVSALRRALGNAIDGECPIVTVRGRGYRLLGLRPEGRKGQSGGQEPPLIAVLPFANLSDDPGWDYFADGVVEEVITALSRMRSLSVIARNSSFAFKGKSSDPLEIGRALNARYVLDGSIRLSSRELRVTAKLIDTESGVTLWADRFEAALQDVFQLQDILAARVVGAITPRVERAEIERAKHKPTENLDAYDYYLRALSNYHSRTPQSLEEALGQLDRAIALDPNFGRAHGLAAGCHMTRRLNGWFADPAAERTEAVRMAREVTRCGKDDATALAFAGLVLAQATDEPEAGLALVERALLLSPNLAVALIASGWVHTILGETGTAISHLSRAELLSPLDPFLPTIRSASAAAHFFSGRYQEAVSDASLALHEQSNLLPALRILAAANACLGRTSQARSAIERAIELDPKLALSTLKQRLPAFPPDNYRKLEEALALAGLPG